MSDDLDTGHEGRALHTTDLPRTLPIFPLQGVLLLPRARLPLHVFEPRYRQMVEDCLDGPGRIVLGTIAAGHEHEHLGAPPIEPVCGLGEIGRHERLSDGRYHVVLVGVARVRVREVESDRLYRQVEAEPIDESVSASPEAMRVREEVCEAIRERVPDVGPIPEQMPLSALVDFLSLRMEASHELMRRLFGETDPLARGREVLGALRGGG